MLLKGWADILSNQKQIFSLVDGKEMKICECVSVYLSLPFLDFIAKQ